MADEKLNTGPGEEKPRSPAPVTVDEPQAPAPEQTAAPTPQQEGPAQPEPGDVVVSFDKINELMNEKRQTARAEVEKRRRQKSRRRKRRRNLPPLGMMNLKRPVGAVPQKRKSGACWQEAAKPRKGRPPKADKAAPARPRRLSETNCPEVGKKGCGG